MNSKLEVLFHRNKSNSESCDDAWDDEALTKAYDRALKVAKEEVAKRIAMSTNTPDKNNKSPAAGCSYNKKWRVGSLCRAPYSENGCEYEATIAELLDEDRCIVKFIGYGNEEEVLLSQLTESKGQNVRDRQIKEAEYESSNNELSNIEQMDFDTSSTEPSHSNKKSRSKSKRPTKMIEADVAKKFAQNMLKNGLPTMPNLVGNMSPSDMPLPPPMPFPLSSLDHGISNGGDDQQALSAMLISWYMTGYYTGLYQGMKRTSQSSRSKKSEKMRRGN